MKKQMQEELTHVYRINITEIGNRAKQLEEERKAIIEFNIKKVMEVLGEQENITDVLSLQQDNEKMEYKIYFEDKCVRRFRIKTRILK